MGEETGADNNLELYKKFPFMEAFPFDDYSIYFEEEDSKISLEVSPILINTLGSISTSGLINFQYIENDAAVTVSFPQVNVLYITKVVEQIKKLDSVAEELRLGLAENDLETKMQCIKKSKKFLKLFKNESLEFPKFEPFLAEMLNLHEVALESELILELQKLKANRLLRCTLTLNEEAAVLAYLNFQLHYCRIILGIVIAVKIF